ncbi:OmpA family protein [Actibacterium sp. 188UL27-1]|nr:OmpA family protein [Actibacterium sp. 188UL27-1]
MTVTDDGDVTMKGLSVTGDGDVDLGGIKTDSEGNVEIGGDVSIGMGTVIGLGDISVDADGGVVMDGLRVEADGSVSMGSEINVGVLTEAMEKPGASVNISILFDSGSAELTAQGKEQVALVAEAFFTFDDDVRVLVEGHTDSVGSDADNFALSNARSQTVVNELKLEHNTDVTLLIGGKGESSPVADNDSDQGRALNRRVTFIRN